MNVHGNRPYKYWQKFAYSLCVWKVRGEMIRSNKEGVRGEGIFQVCLYKVD